MTLDRTELRKRDELLRRAVAEGKVIEGSQLYQTLSDTFAIRPQVAEAMVEQLTPNPLAANHSSVNASPNSARARNLPPAGTEYDPQWLTGPERRRVANAHAGYEPVDHTFE